MELRINLIDVFKFERLFDDSEYLRKVLIPKDGCWIIETDETKEIERLLKKYRIRHKIIR